MTIFQMTFCCIGICLSICLSSCDLLDALGNSSLLWKSSVSKDGYLVQHRIPHIIYNNGVLCLGHDGTREALTMVDRATGKILWQWSDNRVKFSLIFFHVHQNLLVLKDASRTFYVDLNTGILVWFSELQDSFSGLGTTGLGRQYFFPANQFYFYVGDMIGKKERIFHTVTKRAFNESVYPSSMAAYIAPSNDTIVVAPFQYYNEDTFKGQASYTLFNISTSKVIYTTRLGDTTKNRNDNTIYSQPVIAHSKVYFTVGYCVVCHDLATGKYLWHKEFPSTFLSGGIVFADGKIVANCEDEKIYAMNPDTGEFVWTAEGSGTSRPPFFMNGVLYLAGGGDGMLHAIDASNGKILWKIACPEASRNIYFYSHVTGADGKIFVSSYTTMYCYKAAR